MAPKKPRVVHEEDIIPLSKLNKHKVPSSTVKLLKDSHKWNDVLTSNNRKSVLATIQGLTDAMSEEICEAITKIMVSLKSDVDVFTEKTVALLNKECNKEGMHAFVRCVLLEAQVCAQNCYSFDEIHHRFHEEFDFDKEYTEAMYRRFFEKRSGHVAYLQLSTIRAAQRKGEAEQAEHKAEQDEHKAEQAEHTAEQAEHKAEQAEHKVEDQKVDEAEKLPQPETEEKKVSDAQVTSLMDLLTRQKDLFEAVKDYQPKIATKDDIEPLQASIIRRLESVGEKLAGGVASGIEKILSSPRSESSNTLRQSVSSEVTLALSELRTSIKESIDSESETRVAVAVADAVANVTGSIKERISLCLVQGNYAEFFSMALQADDATLGWILTTVKPYLLAHFPADNENILSLLSRLAPLVTVTAEEAGEYTEVFSSWFEMMHKKAVSSGLEITEEVLVAVEHLKDKYARAYALIDGMFGWV